MFSPNNATTRQPSQNQAISAFGRLIPRNNGGRTLDVLARLAHRKNGHVPGLAVSSPEQNNNQATAKAAAQDSQIQSGIATQSSNAQANVSAHESANAIPALGKRLNHIKEISIKAAFISLLATGFGAVIYAFATQTNLEIVFPILTIIGFVIFGDRK